MLFSDLLTDLDPLVKSLYRLRHAATRSSCSTSGRGQVHFPFTSRIEFEDVETPDKIEWTPAASATTT